MVNPNLAKIKEEFDEVIRHSQGIPDPKTDRLFDVWMECKRDFIELFGGKYIYEFPEKVSFDLGPKEKHDRVIRFAGQVAAQWGYTDLANFIESQEDGFFKNLTITDYTAWDGKVIKKGSKLVKAFRHFIRDNDRSLTDIQNEASRIIQEDRIAGTLCLSVHPLDFLSISENTYNWRSCHALDGEYRAGNLSYMMDKHTIVCYLKGGDNMVLPGFGPAVKWNSKKWRVLLYVSEDWRMIIAGRQYPFESQTGMDIVLKEFLPEVGLCKTEAEYAWTDWNNTLITHAQLTNGVETVFDSPYIPVGHTLMALEDLVKNGEGAKQFNDVLSSSCYKPIYTVKYVKYLWEESGGHLTTWPGGTSFHIGGFTYCLWCGEEECLEGADTMLCEECEFEHGHSESDLFTYCDSCGRRVYVDDTYSVGDEGWCEHCFDRYAKRCECCGEAFHEDYIHYNEATQQYVCNYCLEELNEEKES
jgi:hypothetical protein